MDDQISRQAGRMDISDDIKNAYYDGYDNGYNAGFEAGQRDVLLEKTQLSRENTTSDSISRQDAIDFINAGHLVNPNEPRWSDNEVVNFLKSRPSAQPEQRWIPVTERLPDKEDWYIFSTDKLAWVAFWNGIEWSGGVAGAVLEDIIAWKPFPAPYRKEGEAE